MAKFLLHFYKAKLKGCKKLSDKIKLPDRAEAKHNYYHKDRRSKRSTTTSTVASLNEAVCDEKFCINELSPNLKQYLLSNNNNDTIKLGLEEVECRIATRYTKCLSSSMSQECQLAHSRTLERLDKLNKKCLIKSKPKWGAGFNRSNLVKLEWKCLILAIIMFERLIFALL